MALTLSGTNGVVGAGFTLDPSGTSVTAGVGTFGSVKSSGAVNASAVGVSTQIEITDNTGITYNSSGGLSAFYKDVTDGTTMSGYVAAIKTGSAGSRANAMTFSHNKNVTVTSGNIIIGTSGKGIDFSATSDPSSPSQAVSEVFDNYEEGTWTPGISGSTAITGHSYSSRNGFYTRIGDRVFCDFSFVLSAKGTITGTYIKIVNLPYAINGSSNTRSLSSPIYYRHLNASWNFLGLQGHEGQSSCYIYGVEGSGGASNRSYPDGTDISNVTEMTASFSYLAA